MLSQEVLGRCLIGLIKQHACSHFRFSICSLYMQISNTTDCLIRLFKTHSLFRVKEFFWSSQLQTQNIICALKVLHIFLPVLSFFNLIFSYYFNNISIGDKSNKMYCIHKEHKSYMVYCSHSFSQQG